MLTKKNNKAASAGRHVSPVTCTHALLCLLILQMTGRYDEYAEELAKAVRQDFKPHIVKE